MANDRPDWLKPEWGPLRIIWQAFLLLMCGVFIAVYVWWLLWSDTMIWLHGGPRNAAAPIGLILGLGMAVVYFVGTFEAVRYVVGRRRRKAAVVAASIEVITVTRHAGR